MVANTDRHITHRANERTATSVQHPGRMVRVAVPLAAALKEKSLNMGRKVGLILSGGNIDLDLFAERIIVGAHKAGSEERAA